MRLPRRFVLLSALGVGIFQVAGTFGAAHEQTSRKAVDALAIALVLVGPIALSIRDRRPLLVMAASVMAADVYIGLGYPYGPIFVSAAFSLFVAVQAGHAERPRSSQRSATSATSSPAPLTRRPTTV